VSHSCPDTHHCISCSDEAVAGRVLSLLPGKMAAVDFGESTEEVSVELVECVPGDIVLVHAGVAIQRIARELTRTLSGAWEGTLDGNQNR
jgi:hydrogenase maturation factor